MCGERGSRRARRDRCPPPLLTHRLTARRLWTPGRSSPASTSAARSALVCASPWTGRSSSRSGRRRPKVRRTCATPSPQVVEALAANAGAPHRRGGRGGTRPRRPRRRAAGGAQLDRRRRDADPRHARRAARRARHGRQRRDVRDRGRVASRRGDRRVRRVAHHARHRHRRRRRQRRCAATRGERLHVRARAHGRRPERPAVCVRPQGLLGAIRIGQRARSACA